MGFIGSENLIFELSDNPDKVAETVKEKNYQYIVCILAFEDTYIHKTPNFSQQDMNFFNTATFSVGQVFLDPRVWMTLAHFNLLESPFHERSEIHPQESLYKPISVKLTLWDYLYLPHYRKYKYVQVGLFDIHPHPQQQR